ncbi:MAG: ABC transporter permease [Vicinamibacterales bacterium]
MGSVIADLRYAARELRRRPGFALTAVLSLALGIGATSAVFSVVYGVLINPFPYVGADRMMQLALRDSAGRFRYPGLTGAQADQLRQARSVESIVAEDGWNLTTTDGDIPEDVVASYISPNAPNHWGVPALRGRWLIPADAPPGQEPSRVVVLGYQFWQRYYSGDPTVVGRTLQLVRKDYQIVGVMPPRFRWREADIYMPLKIRYEPNIYYGVTLKVRPDASIAAANAELQPLLQDFSRHAPARYPDTFRVHLRSIVELYARPMGPKLFLLLGVVTSLLLVGCANVSILLLVRGAHRQQELAVRAALGAGRGRFVRQLLTESMAIAVVGAALGLLIAWRGLALIVEWIPTNSFAAESVIEMNVPVLLFSTALAVVTAIAFGVWPALQLSRPELGRVAQAGARRVAGSTHGRRVHRVMVGVQVALTLLMLSAAGAAGKGFLRMANTELGYDPEHTMSLPIPVHDGTYTTWKERSEYFERLRGAVATMPQVVSAGISTNATPPANGGDTTLEILASTALQKPVARANFVSAEYFPLLRIPLSQGRLWSRDETSRGAALAVINQTMARQYWPNGDAVGRQFRFVGMKDEPPYSPAASGADGWVEVIGIVADARNDGLRNPIKPAVYVPYTLKLRMFTQILVRTRVPPLSILRDVRAELVRVDREQQVMRVRDLHGWITNLPEYSQQRLIARLFGIFSLLALVLSAVGLYSVVSYGVATRTNEFGIRMALGARARDVVRMVLSGMFWNVGIGVLAGVILCLAFDKVASFWVTETSRDPLILGGVTALLLAVAVVACLAPARRAAAIDPMEALRLE